MEPARERGERVVRRGRGVRMRDRGAGGGARQQQRRQRAVVSDELRATIIDHVVNNGLTFREAGLRVQPNLLGNQQNPDETAVRCSKNSERVKDLCWYVERVMELEAHQTPHVLIYVDEAGFNLAKTCRRGWNVIGKRATVGVPGQREISLGNPINDYEYGCCSSLRL
ncbi:hypothetical protein GJAV_G00087050 [Gymnothorax javanicus]|nr:hypothetical protein GJAV_G00087050 [Gymnothorax javanicus]